MYDSLMLTAAYRLSFYLTPLTAIVATLLGIWIILNKIRSVRILGVCCIPADRTAGESG